jgi:hypothetical protein
MTLRRAAFGMITIAKMPFRKMTFNIRTLNYGKVAYFELSSHQISEPKQQAKRENIYLAKISERLAN